ncbi:MAG: hypothetical protein HY552_04140 [Elusimicrobia bacterium]|nr:hypothetical protein [Elusimicrobiota bacterium]
MAAWPKGARGGLGWVVLTAALAVPAVLFYGWWSRLRAEQERSAPGAARRPLEGGVFQSSRAPARTAAPPPAEPAPEARGAATIPGPAAAAAAAAPVAPAAAIPPAPPEEPAPARDPMLSPMDRELLRRQALEEDRRGRASAGPPGRLRTPSRRALSEIQRAVQLQGIVAKSNGENLAIVNGEVVRAGQTFVLPGRKERVKVLRISAASVAFESGGFRFLERLSRP